MQDTVTPSPLRAIEQPGRVGRGVRLICITFTSPLTRREKEIIMHKRTTLGLD